MSASEYSRYFDLIFMNNLFHYLWFVVSVYLISGLQIAFEMPRLYAPILADFMYTENIKCLRPFNHHSTLAIETE